MSPQVVSHDFTSSKAHSQVMNKLDGEAPLITDPPPISSTILSNKFEEKKKIKN